MVSTYQAGRLILIRPGETLNTHFIGLEKPMGVALSGSRLSVGSSHRVWDYFNMPDVAPKVQPIHSHDACFVPRRSHITGDIDIHEMAFDGHEKLWLVNTRMSCLCTLDEVHSFVPEWRPPFISAYDLGDRCHLNGLAMIDGMPVYATALGETDSPGGWRSTKAHGGVLMDIQTDKVICRGLSMPHSPRWHNGKLYVLESGTGRILTIHPKKGTQTVIAEVPGFCRGISFVGPYALVGLSQVRETAVFAGLPLTKRFAQRFCGIWLVDLTNGNVLGWLQFDGGVQEIFAVQALPWKNPAILDSTDPLVRTSYSLPQKALENLAHTDPLEAEINNAALLRREGKLEATAQKLEELLKKAPGNITASYILGDTLAALGKFERAISALDTVVKNDPSNANAWLILGNCFLEIDKFQKALECYDKALEADKGYAYAHFAKGKLLLRLGRFKDGWNEYIWRRKMADFQSFHSLKPLWKGEALGRKRLLIHLEHCISDALVLARLFPIISQFCQELIVAAPESLRGLFDQAPGVSRAMLPENLKDSEYDVFCPLLNLPCLNTFCDSFTPDIGANIPYLKVPTGAVVSPIKNNTNLKIGLVWSNKREANAIFPLDALTSLSKVQGVKWIGLGEPLDSQQEKMLQELQIERRDHQIPTFSHQAALISQLDLVISVDSPSAHLAGALGVPIWLLTKGNVHWCWPTETTFTPWYPSIRIFRMSSKEDFKYITNILKKEIETLICS